jgi:virulence factor Mce-like protein
MKILRSLFSSKLYVSALGVLLVFLLGVSYLLTEVLDQPLLSRPDQVSVELKAAGGLFEGSAVTYRGVKIGRVTDISLGDSGVVATVSLTSDEKVPASSVAKVRSLSPVGEQYLDFQPTSDSGPWLEDGSVISADSTDIPKSLASTVVAINDVLRQVDDAKLRTLLVELSTALEGTGEDLGRLVDEGSVLIDELDAVYPETLRLLENADVALDIAPDNRADLNELADDATSLASFLKDYDPELDRLLADTPARLRRLEALVQDAREVLPDFLSVGVSLTDIFAAHDPHLRALLRNYAPGLSVLGDQVRNGRLRLKVIGDKDARCRYDINRRGPRVTERRPLVTTGRCSASFSTLQRGAAHAPGPVSR